MPFSFSTALSGLRVSSDFLSSTGNNIANANTVAFKSSSVRFADVYVGSPGIRLNGAGASLQVGSGVRISATPTNYSQGAISETGIATNAAIEGNGFFVVADELGKLAYSRAGDFTIDRNGYVVLPAGQRAQGYAAVNGVIQPGSELSDIQVPLGQLIEPVTTTKATLRMNLNSEDPAGAVFHAPVQVYDSRGSAHALDLIFTRQADGSWQMVAELDGNAAQTSVDGGTAAATPVSFTFDTDGKMSGPGTLSIVPDQTQLNGASLPAIEIVLRQPVTTTGVPGEPNLTSYASASGVSFTDQDGYTAGDLSGFTVAGDRTGVVYAVFSNGQRRPLAQLAMATFNDQAGLRRAGNNLYGETLSSGQPSIGVGGSGGRGVIVSSALEQSNVDLASEFTDLIVAQRSFQANSRVISTISQTLQDLLQIN
jgi:flagellar hook protein FlgE